MPLEHLGIAVPDVDAAKAHYDQMPVSATNHASATGTAHTTGRVLNCSCTPLWNQGPPRGTAPGLQHIAFLVRTRAEVDAVHEWVTERGDEVLHAPREFPEYGPDCYATYFLDPHGFKLEVLCHEATGETTT